MIDQFIKKVQISIEKNNLFAHGAHLLIGLSGGADSVCLALVLKALQESYDLTLTAVHVHHGIRGESANRDLDFSKNLCEKLGIEFVSAYRDVPAIAEKKHLTEEEAGRIVRYQIFEEEAKKRGVIAIAVAHHMDDQAETVLMNLLRGSGIRGLSGISSKRKLSNTSDIFVIRPLLGMRRSEIEEWLTKNKQDWCTDETNLTDDYERCRIRNRLLPLLESEYNAQATEHIASAAGDFSEAEEYLSGQATELLEKWNENAKKNHLKENFNPEKTDNKVEPESISSNEVIFLPIEKLSAEKPLLQRYLIKEAIGRLGGSKDITRAHIESVLSLLDKQTGSQIHLPKNRVARLSYGELVIEQIEKEKKKTKKQPDQNSKIGRSVYSIFPVSEKKIPQNCCVNWFDYDTIKEGLLMRRRRPKDRICIDANGNTQKLSDCMINAKIPAAKRDQIPILAANSRVLWIAGVRMAENCKITSKTKLVLSVQTENTSAEGCDHGELESQGIG